MKELNKYIVVKVQGKWQLQQIEDGQMFTDNVKAIKFFDKKIEEKHGPKKR